MLQLTLAIVVLIILFAGLRIALGRRRLSIRQFMYIYASVVGGGMLVFLGLTGRLNWLFALLGAALPFLMRVLPWISRSLGLASLYRRLRATTGFGAPVQPASGQTSALDTRFFAMTLEHDSGAMNGMILEGQFTGQQLSQLDVKQLQLLLGECRVDNDSVNVLTAYLDRHYPDWHAHFEAPTTTAAMDTAQAYEILGLQPGATREMVINAHRKLMQKFHPDRGGPNYLATQINLAKDLLMEHL